MKPLNQIASCRSRHKQAGVLSITRNCERGFIGTVSLYSPGNASFHPRVHWKTGANDGSGNPDVNITGAGSYLSTTAVDGFRILPSGGGTLASGIVRCYGVAK